MTWAVGIFILLLAGGLSWWLFEFIPLVAILLAHRRRANLHRRLARRAKLVRLNHRILKN